MFSGKTEELIRRLKRAKIANQPVALYKPSQDTRYHETKIVSHNENGMDGIPIPHSKELLKMNDEIQVVGIDEAQFFDMDLIPVCQELALRGKRVVIAGLDMDFKGYALRPCTWTTGGGRVYHKGTCHLSSLWQFGNALLPIFCRNGNRGAGC